MLILYKRHVVKSHFFEEYSQEDIEEVNQKIAKEMYTHPEDFHFYNGKYSPVTSNGKIFLQNLYSQYKKRKYYQFSFSNGEKWVYEAWSFILE